MSTIVWFKPLLLYTEEVVCTGICQPFTNAPQGKTHQIHDICAAALHHRYITSVTEGKHCLMLIE